MEEQEEEMMRGRNYGREEGRMERTKERRKERTEEVTRGIKEDGRAREGREGHNNVECKEEKTVRKKGRKTLRGFKKRGLTL